MADTKITVDCSTGVVTEVELTSAEIEQRVVDAAAYAVAKAEEDAAAQALAELKASARNKLITGNPLTPEEANTLVL